MIKMILQILASRDPVMHLTVTDLEAAQQKPRLHGQTERWIFPSHGKVCVQ